MPRVAWVTGPLGTALRRRARGAAARRTRTSSCGCAHGSVECGAGDRVLLHGPQSVDRIRLDVRLEQRASRCRARRLEKLFSQFCSRNLAPAGVIMLATRVALGARITTPTRCVSPARPRPRARLARREVLSRPLDSSFHARNRDSDGKMPRVPSRHSRPHSGDALTARRSAQVRGARLAPRVAPRARASPSPRAPTSTRTPWRAAKTCGPSPCEGRDAAGAQGGQRQGAGPQ